MDKYYLAALHMAEGIGNAGLQKLVSFFGSAKNAWFSERKSLVSSRLFSDTICNNLLDHREKIDVQKLASDWEKKRIRLCTINDLEYPELLKNIFNPPIILYYRGTLPLADDHTVAIVGARRATAYGKNAAGMLAAELTASGFWVVSGGARGIDSSAHVGALKNGKTVAVLGSGIDIAYPPENRRLFENIAEAGAVVSEYPPGTLVHASHFPARNRIISGLSRGTIIVEAARKSGALITADFALEQGRDVFAVPGSIFSELCKGTNYLIKQGAKLVDSVNDILEEYKIKSVIQQQNDELSSEEMQIYSVLSYDFPIGIEDIVMKTNLTPSVVTYILLQLELRGLADGQSGQRYVRVAREGIS